MRRIFSLFTLAICLQICLSNASSCTDACDSSKTAGSYVVWCGSDGLTHNTTQSAIQLDVVGLNSDCYSLCGISVKYAGQCGCPNDCYSETGNGVCDGTACVCASGWKGADCQSPKCTSTPNACSGNGVCKVQDPAAGDDYCICNNGYTGYDCSVKIPAHFTEVPYGTLPYGENDTPYQYFKGEANGDAHPIFNTSTIATVRITISDADYNYQTNPANRRIMEYVSGNMWFDNGNIRTYQKKISFRLKGLSSRMFAKKSWNVKFDKAWNGIKGISLKAGPEDRSAVFPFVAEMHRMMKAQAYRVTFANLFVNGAFYGVYSLHERMDKTFLQSRLNMNNGTLYQLGQTYYGQYLGSTPQPYQELTNAAFDKIPLPAIELEEGPEDWTDLTMLMTVLNASQLSTPYLSKYYDVKEFLRYSAVDLATDNFDSYYGTGNNYMLMNAGTWANPYWTHYVTDFDNAFKSPYAISGYLGMTPDQLRDLIASGVTSFYGFDLLAYALSPNPYMINNRTGRPFANAVYQLPGVNETFTAYMTDLIQRFIFANPGRMQARLSAFRDMVRPMLVRDKMYALPSFSIPKGIQSFDDAFDVATPAWYNQKYAYLGSMFIAKGHGKCDAMANCVCDQYYSGPTCGTYTPPPPTPPPTPSPTPNPTPNPTPDPTPAPCRATVSLSKRNSWSDNVNTYTQYDIVFTNSGSQKISAAKFLISGNTITQQWNLNTLGNNLYSPNIWNPMAVGAVDRSSYGFTVRGTAAQQISVNSVTCN